MKISSLLTAIFIGILVISFTGCGNPPQPYLQNINGPYKNISNKEKQELLNLIIDRSTRPTYYTSKDGCIKTHIVWGSTTRYDDNMNNCFRYYNNEIRRYDNSICKYGYEVKKCKYIGGRVSRYSDFLNYLQENTIKKELKHELTNYIKFGKLYDKALISKKEKVSQIKTSLYDNTKVLPKSVFNQFNNFKIRSKVNSKISLYKIYVTSRNGRAIRNDFDSFFKDEYSIAPKFKIHSYPSNDTINRYKVNYETSSYNQRYDKFPLNLTFKIDEVYFNYLPKRFISKDKNITVEVANDISSKYNSIKYIKIHNKTKEFIEIDRIAGYYGENVVDNIIKKENIKKIQISPMSYKIFKTGYNRKLREYPSEKLLLVNNRNQKVNYGFSIAYKMINQNILKNLYKVNKYRIKDFK